MALEINGKQVKRIELTREGDAAVFYEDGSIEQGTHDSEFHYPLMSRTVTTPSGELTYCEHYGD